MEIKKVGVVGCGLMGAGIAQVSAQSGYQVTVSEINEELLNKGLKSIDKVLSKGVEKGKISEEDKTAVIGRIKGTTRVDDFADCDIVVEAAVENMDIKKKVFGDLDRICPSHESFPGWRSNYYSRGAWHLTCRKIPALANAYALSPIA